MQHFGEFADALLPHVLKAGQAIMGHYRQGGAVATKAGGFPVTEADHAAEAILLEALASIAPGVPVVAEEMMEGQASAAMGSEFFLVDPLDGTREFIEGRDEFTVNVGLIRDRSPSFGVIYAPALDLLYMTLRSDLAVSAKVAPDASVSKVSELETLTLRTRAVSAGEPLTISASRRHGSEALEAWLRGVNVAGLTNIGSSLKFCQVAEGKADVYPRFGPTKEWDTAAGHAILLAAGGVVTECDGSPLYYGKSERDFLNPFFIASAARMESLYDPELFAGVK
jgi:3'(2'),5'-bisphosphate nucleotidase